MKILIINSGSSSLKYQCMDMETEKVLCSGIVERLGFNDSVFRYKRPGHEEIVVKQDIPDHVSGVRLLMDYVVHPDSGVTRLEEIEAMAHRFVHGADKISQAVIITPEIEAILEETTPLAPLHNPPGLWGYHAAAQVLPDIPHVAVFDTAFHITIPPEAFLFGIPYDYYEKHRIRHYGFHGASHKFVTIEAAKMLGIPLDKVNLITAHIGSGAALTAIRGGKSVENTLGFGTNCGLIMGTRCGDIDSDVVFYMQDKLGMSAGEVKDLLYKKSGLLGLSGISNDMRDLWAAVAEGNSRARLAIDCFVHVIRKYTGGLAANLGVKMDALVFTAGVGENDQGIREEVCSGLEFMGIYLDKEKNKIRVNQETGGAVISRDDSPVKILVIPTNEELMMARETRDCISAQSK